MSGGFESKVGNEYEKEYVVSLWLRMLRGHVHRVKWEAKRGEPEDGVDVWFEDDGGRVAVQCKKRDVGPWPPNELRSVVRYASRVLASGREPEVREFRFVSNSPLSRKPLRAINPGGIDTSLSGPEIQSRVDCFREHFAPDWVAEESLERLALRWRVRVVGISQLREFNSDLAAAATASSPDQPDRSGRLLSALRSLCLDVMGEMLDRKGLLELLSADIQRMIRDPDPGRGLARIEKATSRFLDRANRKRPRVRGEPARQLHIARAEVDRIIEALRDLDGRGAVRMTGFAGAGKSDALAEVARRLRDDGRHVLALEVTEVGGVVDNHLIIDAIAALDGQSRLVLILDQVDQVLADGSSLRSATEDVDRLMNHLGMAACDLVLGCRRTDARAGSELDRLFEATRREGEIRDVPIGDLESDAVADVLGQLGLTPSALDPALRSLVRRPLALWLFVDLWSRDRLPAGDSTLATLLRSWITELVGSDAEKHAAFRAFTEVYRDNGLRGVLPSEIPSDHDVQPLVDVGLLREGSLGDRQSRLFPAHDAVVDYKLAESFVRAVREGGLRAAIPDRPSQTLAVARRLRLATSIIAENAVGGASSLDEVFRSDGIRLNLKRAVLLGLSDLGSQPTHDLVTVVVRWIDDARWRPLVLAALMRGNGKWVRALEDWFTSAWTLVFQEEQRQLLGVLASVSLCEGDFVSRVLRAWMAHEPGVAKLAARVLPSDPSEDSEALFELRRELPREYRSGPSHVRWDRWLLDSPSRAATWFGLQLGELSAESLSSHDDGGSFHGIEAAARSLPAGSGSIIVDGLQPIWRGLELGSLRSVDVGGHNLSPSPAAQLVSLLASAWADRIESDGLRWLQVESSLLGDVPRDQDLWLAMEVGTRLGVKVLECVEGAARYVLSCERCQRLRVGLLLDSTRSIPALWLASHAVGILGDPDLLDRLSALQRGFAPLRPESTAENVDRQLREAEERVSAQRDQWGPEEWTRGLLDTSLDLTWELQSRVSSAPARYLRIVEALVRCEQLDPDLRAELALGACDSSNLIEDGGALADSAAVDLVGDGSLFDDGRVRVRGLARCVADRPSAPWERGVISSLERAIDEALAGLSSGQDRPPRTPTSSSELRIEALFESQAGACARALARIAAEESPSVQEDDVERWRGLVERLARAHSPVLRVAGVALAGSLPGSDVRAAALLASQDPMACLEQTVAWPLFHCIDDDEDPRGEGALAALANAVRAFPQGFVGEAASVWMGLLGRECSVDSGAADRIFAAPDGPVEIARCLVGLSEETVEMPWVAEVIDRLFHMGAEARSTSVENAVEIIARDHRGRLLRSESVREVIVQSDAARLFPRLVASLFDAEGRMEDAFDLVLQASDSLTSRLSSQGATNDWRLRREARETLGLLARLAESLEVEGDTAGREAVLDAIDRVLGAEPAFVMPVEII